ncbi:MAG: lipid-A-disaccharide synthase [Phycisphaerae bacterium]
MQIFISVAEDSADIHAASLMRAAKTILPDARFFGLTGPRMRELGAETVYDFAAHAAMLTGVLSVIGRAWSALSAVEKSWQASRPDVVILIDSPELNLRIAAKAKRLGIPVLYYVAPQTWASRAGRNRKISRIVDRLACILPFEQDYFRRNGVQAEFVGHPLFEYLAREHANPQRVESLRGDSAMPLIALLPGSRKHVIDAVLKLQLDVLRHLRGMDFAFRTAISAVDAERGERIAAQLAGSGIEAEIVVADNASLLTACDFVLVASGTATLHVAHYRKPMAVMYDAGLLGRLYRPLGRWILKTPHLSLVNILAERRIVPEFMPSVPDTRLVAATVRNILRDEGWRNQMVGDLDAIVRPLEQSSASVRVAEIARELIARSTANAN